MKTRLFSIMLEVQRHKAHYKGRLLAEGRSDEEATQMIRSEHSAFRPAFINGKRRGSEETGSACQDGAYERGNSLRQASNDGQ